MPREGGCACGAIRFRIEAALLGTGACHCTDCQKFAGGGPNYVALVPRDALATTRGVPRVHLSKGDSGDDIARAFCPDCGTPLWTVPERLPFVVIKVGAFDERADLGPGLHMYTASAPSWHPLSPELPGFAQMPPGM